MPSLVTKQLLALHDQYDGDLGLLDERWADKRDRDLFSAEQIRTLGEYLQQLELGDVECLSPGITEVGPANMAAASLSQALIRGGRGLRKECRSHRAGPPLPPSLVSFGVSAHLRLMPWFFTLLATLFLTATSAYSADDWQPLFNGKDLTGWRANVMPKSFSVVDGVIRVKATRESAHLFYTGDLKDGFVRFKNFELEATCRSETNSNSGIFIHTDMTTRDKALHLAKGYEIQLNSSAVEKRKTGSLYAVVDLARSPVDESQWFRIRVAVRDQRITIHLNDQQVVDYTEPPGIQRPADRAGRLLSPVGGGIALQAHDPKSVFYFKDIRIKRLP